MGIPFPDRIVKAAAVFKMAVSEDKEATELCYEFTGKTDLLSDSPIRALS